MRTDQIMMHAGILETIELPLQAEILESTTDHAGVKQNASAPLRAKLEIECKADVLVSVG